MSRHRHHLIRSEPPVGIQKLIIVKSDLWLGLKEERRNVVYRLHAGPSSLWANGKEDQVRVLNSGTSYHRKVTVKSLTTLCQRGENRATCVEVVGENPTAGFIVWEKKS